jgi:hypothetical protein
MQSGSTTRIVGWLLLLMGTLLVLSIAWAAIGFLSLGIGLICLQVAEKKRKLRRLGSSPSPAVGFSSSGIDETLRRETEPDKEPVSDISDQAPPPGESHEPDGQWQSRPVDNGNFQDLAEIFDHLNKVLATRK